MFHEIDDTGGVSVLVIIPGNKLDKVGVEHDTGISIEDGGADITFEISMINTNSTATISVRIKAIS